MSHNTWVHRAIAPVVRPLSATPVTPNHLTAMRVLTGLIALWCFAGGNLIWGGAWYLLSALFDRADGMLARLRGTTTRAGHYLDLASDFLMDALLFVSLGYGLRGGEYGGRILIAGVVASVFVAAIFLLISWLQEQDGDVLPADALFDPDDVMLLLPLPIWLGFAQELVFLAALGAPSAFLVLLYRLRHRLRAFTPQRTQD